MECRYCVMNKRLEFVYCRSKRSLGSYLARKTFIFFTLFKHFFMHQLICWLFYSSGLWEGEAKFRCVGRSDGDSETKEEIFLFNINIFSGVILLIKNHLSEVEYPQYKLLQL
ncbi:hypothetical protein NC651_012702 [Populus alba x Populus x berolinensis]|uniref:Uncharacterized protein n=1 Tax=Populus alba x Populus x berolinensis TaxID=444605 RepID=A0AAD6QTS4_9ROSI|nr:hypothetical protein NC651_012702 [Populus alba x Populus x berolinensis]KAJ6996292.1 hypothetical protein NC653_013018 [Populus alba x Populus x berolinensis]